MQSYTASPAVVNMTAAEHFQVGYALYVAQRPTTACANIFQRRGWNQAELGHMASVDCDTAAYLGGGRS